jgi:G3E family GTPase
LPFKCNLQRYNVAMKDALSVHKDATAEEFMQQEQKLREATEIISELRQALLAVMHVKDGSVAGGSVRGGGGGDTGSDGGRSNRSGRSSHRSRPPHPQQHQHSQQQHEQQHQQQQQRPMSPAALLQAREESRLRSEEAIRRWEAVLEVEGWHFSPRYLAVKTRFS